ncbi:MAG: hypothetical protein J6V35_04700 [Bacteroidales bacterium]|nr:hypothetical protein [Bacteroidales bacterium]
MRIPHFQLTKRVKRILLLIILLLVLCFLSAFVFVWANQEKIKQVAIKEINKSLLTEVMVKEIDVEFFSSFPMVSVVFSDVVINDVLDSLKQDKFVAVKELGVRFNLFDILSGHYIAKKIFVENGQVNLRINSQGESNYVFWKQSEKKSTDSDFAFALNSVEFKDIEFSFRNDISRLFLKARADEVSAKGDFSSKFQDLDLKADLILEAFAFDELKISNPQSLICDIEAYNNTEKALLSIKKAEVYLNEMLFDLAGAYSYNNQSMIDLTLLGKQIDLKEVVSIFALNSQDILKGFQSEGLVNFSLTLKGELSKSTLPEINANFDIVKGGLRNKKLNVNCQNITLKGSYSNGENRNSKTSQLKIDNFSLKLNNGFFEGRLLVSDFSDIKIDAEVKTNLMLEDIKPFLKQDSLQVLKGNISANLKIKTKIQDFNSLICSGKAKIKNFGFKDLRLPLVVVDNMSCDITFDTKKILIEQLSALFNSERLKASAVIQDKKIKADVDLNRYKFNDLVLQNIKGKLEYSNNVVSTNDLKFDVFQGGVSTKDCKLIFGEKENVLNASCQVKNINIKQTFTTLKNFSQNVITDKNLEGTLSANGVLNLYFDKDFNFLSDKSSFNINYSISKGRLKDFSLMKKLSLFVEEEALKDVRFENIESSLQLNNSSLNFEPIKIKTNIVDFECFGKHGLDNKIDYQFAINLLRNTKVFVKVEGLINDPKFKFNLQSDMKKVKEKVNQDKSEIIKSIDRDFKLNLEEAKKDKQEWEKQEKGEFIIEWEEEKQPKEEEKQFEDSDFIIEW